jgi:hypothetical protein
MKIVAALALASTASAFAPVANNARQSVAMQAENSRREALSSIAAGSVGVTNEQGGFFKINQTMSPPFKYANTGVNKEQVCSGSWHGSIEEGWAAGSTYQNTQGMISQNGDYAISFVEPWSNLTRISVGRAMTYKCVEGMPGHVLGTCLNVVSAYISHDPKLSVNVRKPASFCHLIVYSKPAWSDSIYIQWWDSDKYCNFTYEDLESGEL